MVKKVTKLRKDFKGLTFDKLNKYIEIDGIKFKSGYEFALTDKPLFDGGEFGILYYAKNRKKALDKLGFCKFNVYFKLVNGKAKITKIKKY